LAKGEEKNQLITKIISKSTH